MLAWPPPEEWRHKGGREKSWLKQYLSCSFPSTFVWKIPSKMSWPLYPSTALQRSLPSILPAHGLLLDTRSLDVSNWFHSCSSCFCPNTFPAGWFNKHMGAEPLICIVGAITSRRIGSSALFWKILLLSLILPTNNIIYFNIIHYTLYFYIIYSKSWTKTLSKSKAYP